MANRSSRSLIFVLCVLSVLCVDRPAATAPVPPVRTMYNNTLAREETVRTALTVESPSPAVLDQVHEVIARYEALVRHYPASGYSDNALWQAGRLALDAFARFGQPRDKTAGVRLLRTLEAQYPTSKLAKRVGAELARAEMTVIPETTSVGAEL